MSIVHIAFYPSDWLAGTRGLSDAETGVYITLIARMYEMAGPIERDDQRLFRLCGCKTRASFVRSLEYLISEGKIVCTTDGLFNERVQKEIQKTTEKSTKARTAAQSRWDRKPNKNNATTHANASPKHMPQRCQSEPESEPDKIRTPIIPKQAEKSVTEILAEVASLGAAEDFVEHRRQIKKPLTPLAAKKMANRLASEPDADAILNLSIENGWQGIFPGKVHETQHGNRKPKLINGGMNGGQQSPGGTNRLQRIVSAAARGSSGTDWG